MTSAIEVFKASASRKICAWRAGVTRMMTCFVFPKCRRLAAAQRSQSVRPQKGSEYRWSDLLREGRVQDTNFRVGSKAGMVSRTNLGGSTSRTGRVVDSTLRIEFRSRDLIVYGTPAHVEAKMLVNRQDRRVGLGIGGPHFPGFGMAGVHFSQHRRFD